MMADETKPEEENGEKAATTEKKRKEPTSETLQNFSRVTPGQLPHISFPPDARFQPVRSFIPPSPAAKARLKGASKGSIERHAGGGGIIMLIDRKPGEETKFVDLPPELGGEQPAAMNVDREPSEMLLDVEEAPMPEPFEVSYFRYISLQVTDGNSSTHSTVKHVSHLQTNHIVRGNQIYRAMTVQRKLSPCIDNVNMIRDIPTGTERPLPNMLRARRQSFRLGLPVASGPGQNLR